MLPVLRPFALVLLFGLPMPAATAEIAWRHWAQLPVSAEGLPVFADLDGDGSTEIVFGTKTWEAQGWPTHGLTVLTRVDDTLIRETSIPLSFPLFSLVTAKRPGQSDSVLVTVDKFGVTHLLEFSGLNLELLRDVVVPVRTRLQEVVDMDGDGALDILADTSANSAGGVPLILDYANAVVQWQGLEHTDGVIAEQLDSDPALEIISRGHSGRIYDGATGQQEWSWPGWFGQSVVSGRFEADVTIPGFVSSRTPTVVFRASPYSPLRELPGPGHMLTAFDANADGRDELYATRESELDFVRISAETGAVESLLMLDAVALQPRLGRLQPTNSTVAVLGSSVFSTYQPRAITVFDMDLAQVVYQADYDKAPWWLSAFLQSHPSQPPTALSMVGRFPTAAAEYPVDLEVRDAGTGQMVATRPNVFPIGSYPEGAAPMVADIDGVPGDEIVALRTGLDSAMVALLDGSTLEDRWRVGGFGSSLGGRRMRGWTLLDRNKDGVKDIVLATTISAGTGVRLMVLSGSDGAVLWESVTIPETANLQRVGLVAGEIDAQPGGDIVLAVGNAIYAFDAESGLMSWIVEATDQAWFTDVVYWGTGDNCRIGAVVLNHTLQQLSCVDRTLLSATTLPARTERVAPLDAEGRVLSAVVEGKLLVSYSGGAFQLVLSGLGERLGLNWPWAVRSSPDSISVLLGSTLQVLRADLVGDRLLASGFEALP